MIKSEYIRNIMKLLVDTDETTILLKPQLELLIDKEYNYTGGAGLFVTFKNDSKINNANPADENIVIDGVTINSIDQQIEAQAILHIKNGLINNLEIWCVTNNYPNKDLEKYILTQNWIGSENRHIVVEK